MTDWATFTGFVGVVLVALLLLAHASQRVFDDENDTTVDDRAGPTIFDDADHDAPATASVESWDDDDTPSTPTGATPPAEGDGGVSPSRRDDDLPVRVRYGPERAGSPAATPDDVSSPPSPSTAALLANVAVSQGAFGLLIVIGAWLTEIPPSAFGLAPATVSPSTVAIGAGLGVTLYVANELGAVASKRFGLGESEELRAALAPDSIGGWVVLLLVVLPIIAGFEELLFRGALVGVLAAGFGLSPWLLAAFSSVAFALGHGAQGPAGIVVTGVLGFVLAVAYVLSGSLLVVVVAHYLVNALEFVVHEGLGVDWAA